MGPAEEAERVVVQRLKTERHAVDARRSQIGEAGGFDGGGIGLQCDLDVRCEAPVPLRCFDQTGDGFRRHERGRAAAEEDRADLSVRFHRSEENTSELQSLMRISYAV